MDILEKYSLKKEDWYFLGEWQMAALNGEFWFRWYEPKMLEMVGLPMVEPGLLVIDGFFFVRESQRKEMVNFVTGILKRRDGQKLREFKASILSIIEDHMKLGPDSKNIAQSWKDFVLSTNRIMAPWTMLCIISDDISSILLGAAKDSGIPEIEFLEAIPEQDTILISRQKEIRDLKKKIERSLPLKKGMLKGILADPMLAKDFNEHLSRHSWVGTHHFWGEGLTPEKLVADILEYHEPARRRSKVPEEYQFLLDLSSDLAMLRQYCAEAFSYVAYMFRPLMEEMASISGISYEQLIHMLPSEISLCLQESSDPDLGLIKSRQETGYAIIANGFNEIMVDNAREVNALKAALVPKPAPNIDSLSGHIASKGKAQGRARIFLVPQDMEKMEKGDILVTTMTTPDFVPLMQKASAIVTDIGGLLSHAAIVSREMGKPCIVGTGFATKIFKDDDLLEVDADKGIVKKVK